MPFSCIKDSIEIFSFSFSTDEWTDLKKNYHQIEICMSCCGAKALPKTSQYGTQFFAHKKRGECPITDESNEHMYAKYLCARAALEIGWQVEFERRSDDKKPNVWISDLIIYNDKVAIPVEIQWSSQTFSRTRERQAKYNSRVFQSLPIRTLWLQNVGKRKLKSLEFHQKRWLPLFDLQLMDSNTLQGRGTKEFIVSGIKPLSMLLNPRTIIWQHLKSSNSKTDDSLKFELTVFIKHLLSGDIQWFPSKKLPIHAYPDISSTKCPTCRKMTSLIQGIDFYLPEAHNSSYYLLNSLPLSKITNFEYQSILEQLNSNKWQTKFGHGEILLSTDNSYLSNHCRYCASEISPYISEKLASSRRKHSFEKNFYIELYKEDRLLNYVIRDSLRLVHGWYFIK
ncbi:hypothetical protein AAJP47_05410 [Psychrobacter sp. B38]|uniref:hypothetical protein n=1 Tax=Psychrobacter sp. B38 TaxID=3143538 RepID=UPI003210A1A4